MKFLRWNICAFIVFFILAMSAHSETETMTTLPDNSQGKYNKLNDLKDMKGKVESLGGFEAIRSIILHDLTDKQKESATKYHIYISVNHRHFALSKDMALVEDSACDDSLSAYPQNVAVCKGDAFPYRWNIYDNGTIAPIEWSKDSGVKDEVSDPDFLRLVSEILKIIKDHNMHDCFGISTVRRDSLPSRQGFAYLERTNDGASRVVLVPTHEMHQHAMHTAESLLVNNNEGGGTQCVYCVPGYDGSCSAEAVHDTVY